MNVPSVLHESSFDSTARTWTFRGCAVDQLVLGLSEVRFISIDLLFVRLATALTFTTREGQSHTIDPEHPPSAAPLLALTGSEIVRLSITREGSLEVRFSDLSKIEVLPHPTYEAWEVLGSGELKDISYFCDIGGGSPW